jgi:hypothetical protein
MKVAVDSDTSTDELAVYRRSERGAAQLFARPGGSLSARERQLLILLDGRRTIAELSQYFGAEAVRRLAAGLEMKGLARRADPVPAPKPVDGVTRFDVGSPGVEPPKPTLRWYRDWFALTNVGMLALVILMASGIWALARRPSDVTLPFGTQPARPSPIDAGNAPEPNGDIDATDLERSGHGRIKPLSPLPPVAPSTSGRAAPPVVRESRRAPA